MNKVGLSSPWVIYFRKVEALFEQDPDVKVELDNESCELKIYVESAVKAEAIEELLPSNKIFGNVTLNISVIPSDPDSVDKANLIRRAFEGNPALVDIVHSEIIVAPVDYVIFQKKVVQYFSDDTSDLHGLTSTLYEDIARDVLGMESDLYYCTDTEDVK